MPRPKKVVDMKLILRLHAEGLSSVAISKQLNVSQPTIWRIMNRAIQNSSTSKKSGVIHNSIQNSKPIQNSSDVKQDNVMENNVSGSLGVKVSTTTLPQPAPFGTPHRLSFSINYSGKQPLNSSAWEVNKSVQKARYEGEGWVIITDKSLITIWINDAVQGNTREEIKARAMGMARRVLGEFSIRYRLKLDWRSFIQKTEMEVTLKSPYNEVMMPIVKEVKQEAKAKGVFPGDGSHDEVEFHKEALKLFDGLSYVANQLPQDFKSVRDALERIENNSMERDEKISENVLKINIQRMEELSEMRKLMIKLQSHMATREKLQDNQEKYTDERFELQDIKINKINDVLDRITALMEDRVKKPGLRET